MKIGILAIRMIGKEATFITIRDFSRELINKGYKVIVISEKGKGEDIEQDIPGVDNYKVGGFKLARFYNKIFSYGWKIRKIQKKEKISFDIIQNFSAAPLFVLRGYFTKLFTKAKLVHTLKSYSKSKWGRRFYKLLNLADVITVPTNVFAQKLIKKGVNRKKIHVIHSHIDTNKFRPMNKNNLKKKYGYKNKKIVLYYGSLWEMKGANYLIKMIPKVVAKNKNVVFIIAPRNLGYAIKFKKPLKYLNLDKNIKFIEEDINIVEYVNMADSVVLPYPTLIGTEGNPSCLLEAMACKTPVVTTDFPELREIVDPDEDVLMAKPRNVESLAEELNKLLKDKKLQKKLAENAYKKSKKFDVRKITKQFIDLYEKLLS